jgi:hypothetical protein
MNIRSIGLSFGAVFVFSTGVLADAPDISGHWAGMGYVNAAGGAKEAIRCRVTYDRQTDRVFAVKASCASQALKITQTGVISKASAERYTGRLYNSEYDITARVRVIVKGSKQTLTITADEGAGVLRLTRL